MRNKVSVIIPIYKVEKYLNKCIESVVGQTHRDLEIILVDDGSPDGCPAICDAWAAKDSRIKVIHQDNKGLSGARNSGIEVCTGEYVCFIDSDDYVSKDYVEKLLLAAEGAGADVAICRFYLLNDASGELVEPFKMGRADYSAETIGELYCLTMVKSPVGYAWNKLYRRELIGASRFEEGRLYEDGPFNSEVLLNAKKIVTITDCLYCYRQRADSIVSAKDREKQVKKVRDYCHTIYVCIERLKGRMNDRQMTVYAGFFLKYLLDNAAYYGKEEKRIAVETFKNCYDICKDCFTDPKTRVYYFCARHFTGAFLWAKRLV